MDRCIGAELADYPPRLQSPITGPGEGWVVPSQSSLCLALPLVGPPGREGRAERGYRPTEGAPPPWSSLPPPPHIIHLCPLGPGAVLGQGMAHGWDRALPSSPPSWAQQGPAQSIAVESASPGFEAQPELSDLSVVICRGEEQQCLSQGRGDSSGTSQQELKHPRASW